MKIFCVGKNYRAHAREMKSEVPDSPLIFMKPETALLNDNLLTYPDFSDNIHYEAELVLELSKKGKNIPEEKADQYFNRVTLGIDFTARDIQSKHKEKGWPWELAKAFDGSAAIGDWLNKEQFKDLQATSFRLHKNEQQVQQGNTSDLIFSFHYLIHFLSIYFTLQPGDLLFTGTPQGVGPVQQGDILQGFIQDEALLNVKIQ